MKLCLQLESVTFLAAAVFVVFSLLAALSSVKATDPQTANTLRERYVNDAAVSLLRCIDDGAKQCNWSDPNGDHERCGYLW